MLSTRFYFCIVITLILCTTYAQPNKLRAVFLEDPSTKITIVFNTSNSPDTSPLLYYGTDRNAIINNTSAVAYRDEILSNNSKGMYNNFVKLTGLNPGTTYYFKIKDNTSETPIYYFETVPDNTDERLSFVAGGDSRNNRLARQHANTVVSKLKPHAVFFDGDFTDSSTDDQWQQWIDDWQLTVSDDGRITPLVVARGNHENNNGELTDLFGTNSTAYYALSFGGNLFKAYTLNTENTMTKYASQTDWLKQQLVNDQNYIFKFAQYHKPMRPHTRLKLDGAAQYAYWAPLFYQYNVDLVLESDAHTANTTHPIIPCTGGFGCKDGFKEDALNGTVYTGQGTWGAPLRPSDEKRSWTFYAEMINQFKLIFVDKEKIELRTIDYENSLTINEVDINNRFELPKGLSVKAGTNKLTGQLQDVMLIPSKKNSSYPKIEIALPKENAIYYNQVNVDVVIKNLTSLNNINTVVFLLDGVNKGLDTSAPFSFRLDESEFSVSKSYEINAIAYDVNGVASPMVSRRIKFLNGCTNTIATQLKGSFNDAEQSSNGRVDVSNYDLDLGYNGTICGIRFTNANLPSNVIIHNANIKFTADEDKLNPTSLIFYGEDNSNSVQFSPNINDISSRIKTLSPVNWQVPNWGNVGDNGLNQQTPDLKNIIQHLVNRPDWNIESPITFIIEGSGYRVSETFDSDSLATPILTVQYSCNDTYLANTNVWPGDADNNGIVNAKDVLYICLADGLQGFTRPNASTNWQAQAVLSWPGNIAGSNNARQDSDGNGIINLNDVDVVDLNYGKQVATHNPIDHINNDGFILKQVSLSGVKEIEYDLILKTEEVEFGHGISGSIDLSDLLREDGDSVKIHPNLTDISKLFEADTIFTKYHKDSKTLDFAISKTNKKNEQVNDKILLRLIIVVDPIEGGKVKDAGFSNCGVINAEGSFKTLKSSQNKIININNSSNINGRSVENIINLNLVSQNVNCNSKGSAKIIVSDELKNKISIRWSNNESTSRIEGLDIGQYYVIIENEDGNTNRFEFSIKNESNIDEELQVSQPILRDGIYSASNKINLNSGTEITKNKTVEFLIENCD